MEGVAGVGQGEGGRLELVLEMAQQRIIALDDPGTVPFAFVELEPTKKLLIGFHGLGVERNLGSADGCTKISIDVVVVGRFHAS